MPGVVVVGCQWGDEGKGKIVDYLAEHADVVVRFQGGSNAGHTIESGRETYRLRLLPSGILHKKKLVIGNGVVIDLEVLLNEIEGMKAKGLDPDLALSDRAHVTFSYHLMLDAAEEKFKGSLRAGTTLRGVGPTYSDKVARYGIRVVDLLDEKILEQKISQNMILKVRTLDHVYGSGQAGIDKKGLLKTGIALGEAIRKYVADASLLVNKSLDEGKRVLFEGAQGLLLDIDHGVYPYVTSSNTISGAVCTGVGIGPKRIDEVLGVVKAYTSRVGVGPFPTELMDDVGSKIQEKGQEFGTVTGRRRRIGWLDAVCLRYARRLNGLTGICLTRVDTLGGFNPVRICTHYIYKGTQLSEHPASLAVYGGCEPFYEDISGWPDLTDEEWLSIARKGYDALPTQLKTYVNRIEELTETPVKIISVGRLREATIVRTDLWNH